ncbi:MAG: hypothetical protein JWM58_2155 [Rhizobium sp.]|nr:hypothetical protein [Rhizobium sp.]
MVTATGIIERSFTDMSPIDISIIQKQENDAGRKI